MRNRSFSGALLASLFLFAGAGAFPRAHAADTGIKVDIPVHLKQADAVFNMDHAANDMGDTPIGMNYMHLLAVNYEKNGTKGRIVGVFHGDGGYLLLNDKAFDAFTHGSTGNPYKEKVAELLKQGVGIEECAVTMKAHRWVNEDLLPGVQVDAGAVARIIQLVQDGYVQLHY